MTDDASHDDGRPGVTRRAVLTGTIGTAAGVAGVGLVGHRATADSDEPAEPPEEPVPVDLPGVADPTPATTATALKPGELTDGWIDHVVGADRFVRLMVRDGSGAVVGESNPLWILREPPARGVPEARLIDDRPAGGGAVGGGQNEMHGVEPGE